MTPKIVTRLANIAAKLAGSDKYDPTVKPKTALEYYLDKGVDKILAIKGVPAVEAGDKGKVLSVSDSCALTWENKGPLYLEFATENPYTVATPLSTIKAAIDAGKAVWFLDPDSGRYFSLNTYGYYNGNIEWLCFGGPFGSGMQSAIYYEGTHWGYELI